MAFALIFTENPSAIDIFKKTELPGSAGAWEVNAKLRVKRKSWEECEGKILSIGPKNKLAKLRVNCDGEILAAEGLEEGVSNRFQELLKKKKEMAITDRERYLGQVGEGLLQGGPGPAPISGSSKPSRLPKKRSEEMLQELRVKMETLSCTKAYSKEEAEKLGLQRLVDDQPVYGKASVFVLWENIHARSPSKLFISLLEHLIPKELLSCDGISACGTRETVGIPESILAAINLRVVANCEVNKVSVDYSISKLVNNHLRYLQGKGKKQSSSTQSSATSTSSAATPSPHHIAPNLNSTSSTTETLPETSPSAASTSNSSQTFNIDTVPDPFLNLLSNLNTPQEVQDNQALPGSSNGPLLNPTLHVMVPPSMSDSDDS